MGCWFDLAIEALFDGKWVVIVKMGDGTSSGGYPLTDAMWSLLKFHGIRGAYGIEFPYEHNPPVLWRDTTVVESESTVAEKDKAADPETDHDSDSSQNQGGGSDNDDSEEDRSPRPRVSSDPWEVAYYSSEHVSLLAERCGPTLSRVNRSARTYQQKEYLGLMPAWMDLARYAYPYEEKDPVFCGCVAEFYDLLGTGDKQNLEKVPNILKKQREIRQGKLTRMVTIALGPCLKEDICKHIAEYALPVATDVRLFWGDAESYANDMRKGAEAPPCTGDKCPDCVIQ
jgi:hypothetical protein